MGAVSRGGNLVETDEEHQHNRDEGGKERNDQKGERLKTAELLADGVIPVEGGKDRCRTECASSGRHGGGCADDSCGC